MHRQARVRCATASDRSFASSRTSSCPTRTLSLEKGAIYPWAKTGVSSPYYEQTLESLAKHYKVSMKTPWERLPKHVQLAILYGSGDEDIVFTYWDGTRNYSTEKPFEGVIGNIERRFEETDSDWVREELSRYQAAHPCEACGGYRLKPQALAVKIGGKHIGEVCDLSIKAANVWFEEIPKTFTKQQAEIATRILKEIRDRLKFLNDVGLRIPDAVAVVRHAVGRRKPAHPPRLADRLRADGRALRARRAVDRVASARQRRACSTRSNICATSATPSSSSSTTRTRS